MLHRSFHLMSFPAIRLVGLGILVVGVLGCTHPISSNFRQSVDPSLTFPHVAQSTDSFMNQPVIFGGVIVETRNFPEKTEIEVVQKELDSSGYPKQVDQSGGRFIFVKKGFLEPEVYSKGRQVTGAGIVKGSREGKVDGRDYQFPIIEVDELHLWNPPTPYYYPYYYPYSYPFYGSPFRRHYFGHFGYFGRHGYW